MTWEECAKKLYKKISFDNGEWIDSELIKMQKILTARLSLIFGKYNNGMYTEVFGNDLCEEADCDAEVNSKKIQEITDKEYDFFYFLLYKLSESMPVSKVYKANVKDNINIFSQIEKHNKWDIIQQETRQALVDKIKALYKNKSMPIKKYLKSHIDTKNDSLDESDEYNEYIERTTNAIITNILHSEKIRTLAHLYQITSLFNIEEDKLIDIFHGTSLIDFTRSLIKIFDSIDKIPSECQEQFEKIKSCITKNELKNDKVKLKDVLANQEPPLLFIKKKGILHKYYLIVICICEAIYRAIDSDSGLPPKQLRELDESLGALINKYSSRTSGELQLYPWTDSDLDVEIIKKANQIQSDEDYFRYVNDFYAEKYVDNK